MPGDDGRTTRIVVATVLGVVVLVAAAVAYLVTFPDAELKDPPPQVLPGLEQRAYADDPTPEELAEGDLPAPREDAGDWPAALDCGDFGPIVAARDVYTDVGGEGAQRGQRPSASLDLGAVRLAHSPDFLCLTWVARRPPRVPMVIDLQMREVPATAAIWAVRLTIEPKDRFVSVSWPGLGFRARAARLDIVRRRGRVVLNRAAMPHGIPEPFQFQVVSRSQLFRGSREFFDCVPDAAPAPYPRPTASYVNQALGCRPQP